MKKAFDKCPECGSYELSYTLLGSLTGEDPNHYVCHHCWWSSHPDCRIGTCAVAKREREEQKHETR